MLSAFVELFHVVIMSAFMLCFGIVLAAGLVLFITRLMRW